MKDKSVLEDTAGLGRRGRGYDLVQIEADLPWGAAAVGEYHRVPDNLKAGCKPAQVAQISDGPRADWTHTSLCFWPSALYVARLGRLRGSWHRAEQHRDHAGQPQRHTQRPASAPPRPATCRPRRIDHPASPTRSRPGRASILFGSPAPVNTRHAE